MLRYLFGSMFGDTNVWPRRPCTLSDVRYVFRLNARVGGQLRQTVDGFWYFNAWKYNLTENGPLFGIVFPAARYNDDIPQKTSTRLVVREYCPRPVATKCRYDIGVWVNPQFGAVGSVKTVRDGKQPGVNRNIYETSDIRSCWVEVKV